MATTILVLLRVLCATLLGLFGCLVALVGLYLLVGGASYAMLGLVLLGLALLYGSGRLFKTTLALPA